MPSSGFNYSKWDNIELSDDEDDVHPNIDKDSWFRLKHRTRVEKDEDEGKVRAGWDKNLAKLKDDMKVYGEAGKEHAKAKKMQKEIDELEEKIEKMEKEKKWNVDNMSKLVENKTTVSEDREAPKPEPRLQGEAVAKGYVEYVEEHEELLEKYIALGCEDLEDSLEILKEHGGTLLQGEHAESYLLLDCLEKEMNGEHNKMTWSARQAQLLTQLREFSRASSRPVRDAVNPVFQRLLEHDSTKESFEETVNDFIKRIEVRAEAKKKEMDAESATAAGVGLNPPGPGGLDPIEVLHTLPAEMRSAFEAQDIQRLQAFIDSLPEEDAKYHLRRCEDSGLWVPSGGDAPPYREEDDSDGDP